MNRVWGGVTETLTGDSTPELTSLYGSPLMVGVASKAQGEVKTFDPYSDIHGTIGYGPLARAVQDFFAHGGQGSRCIVRVLTPDNVGTNGSVTQEGTGTATATAGGTPNDDYKIKIVVLTGGDTGTAVIKYSIDGGNTYEPKITTPVDGVVTIGNTGATMTFGTSTNPLVEDDTYSWDTTAPTASNSVITTALDAVLPTYRGKYEILALIGPSALAIWTLISGKVETEWNSHNPIVAVVEATKYESATKDTDIASLITDRDSFTDRRVMITASQVMTVDSDGYQFERTGAGMVCGALSKGKISESIGRTKDDHGKLTQATALSPSTITVSDLTLLNDAGFTLARKYEGFPGYWWNDGNVMSAPGDPFAAIEEIRVGAKALRLWRVAALRNLHLDGDGGSFGGQAGLTYLKAELERATRPMENNRELWKAEAIIMSTSDQVFNTSGVNVQCDFVTFPKMKHISLVGNLISPDEFDRRHG